MGIKSQITDVINLLDSPAWRAMEPREQNQILIMELSEVTAEILAALEPDMADVAIPAFIRDAEELYDEYIVPINLTGTPFVERIIDSKGRKMIGPMVRKMYAEHNR